MSNLSERKNATIQKKAKRYSYGGGALFALLILTNCAPFGITLFSQTLPVTDHAVWDVEPAIYSVTNYIVTVDGTAQNFAPASCGPTTCVAPIVLSTFGPHQVTVAAQNLALSTDPTSIQTGPAASVSFTQSQQAPATTHTTVTK